MSEAPRVYLLVGDPFSAEEALDRIRAETGADTLSEASFDSGLEPADVIGALQTPSLLGGTRLVMVRDVAGLKKDQIAAIEDYLAAPAGHSTLVLLSSGKTKLEAAVRAVGAVIALETPKGRKLATWVRERGRVHGLKLDDRACWALIDAVGTELRDLDNALEQLQTFDDESLVGAAQVKQMFPRLSDERIYAFTDGVGDRKLAVAMAALRRLFDQGDEPLVIFGALTGQVRRMLHARPHVDGGARGIEEALGLPGWRAERLHRQSRSYREDELVAAMQLLSETDVELKSGAGEAASRAALERAVVTIVG
ncbi:MAG TPA: DNA polymerase III subunit delta [Actinomycetota bacterium]|nr:DNA polymerase III subunit delta [Actinomycetota bacterium]